jgi:hypothetical protein
MSRRNARDFGAAGCNETEKKGSPRMPVELFEAQETQETFDLDVQEVGGIVSDEAEAAYPTVWGCGPGGGRTPVTCTFSTICCCP